MRRRQINDLDVLMAELSARVEGIDRVTDAKFTTLRTVVDSQAEKVALALTSADKAVAKAETASEKRFESVNEFRQTLSDQAQNFITRVEFDALRQSYLDRLTEINSRLDKAEGTRQGLGQGWGYLIGAVGVILALLTIAGLIASR